MNQSDADEDEDSPHNEGAQDTPEEYLVLVALRQRERGEDKKKDEHVIDAEGIFDQIGAQKFQGFLRTFKEVDAEIKEQGQGYPEGAPPKGLLYLHHVCFSMKEKKIEGEHDEDKQGKKDEKESLADHAGPP